MPRPQLDQWRMGVCGLTLQLPHFNPQISHLSPNPCLKGGDDIWWSSTLISETKILTILIPIHQMHSDIFFLCDSAGHGSLNWSDGALVGLSLQFGNHQPRGRAYSGELGLDHKGKLMAELFLRRYGEQLRSAGGFLRACGSPHSIRFQTDTSYQGAMSLASADHSGTKPNRNNVPPFLWIVLRVTSEKTRAGSAGGESN